MAFERAVRQLTQLIRHYQPYQVKSLRLQMYFNILQLKRDSVLTGICIVITHNSVQHSWKIFSMIVWIHHYLHQNGGSFLLCKNGASIFREKDGSSDPNKIASHIFISRPLWITCSILTTMCRALSYHGCAFYCLFHSFINYLIVWLA